MDFEGMLNKAMSSKEAGNEHFRKEEYQEALECYTNALTECPQEHQCKVVFLKNRAACYLKLQQYSLALCDCTQALSITPNDVKALYRRAVAHKALGNLSDAFADLKILLSIERQNKEAMELAQSLTVIMKKQHETLQSTEGRIKEMFEVLRNPNLSRAKVAMVVKNCAILSQERAGADKLYEAGAVDLLLPLLDLGSSEVTRHVLQVFVGLCVGHKARAYTVIQKLSLEKFSALISHDSNEVVRSVIAVIKEVMASVSSESVTDAADTAILIPIVRMIFDLLVDPSLSSSARDYIMQMLITIVPKVTVCMCFLGVWV